MNQAGKELTQKVIRHAQVVGLLLTRKAGDRFEDHMGEQFEVVRVANQYPQPGYMAKRIGAKEARFIGFDRVKDARLNPTLDWRAARREATTIGAIPDKLVYCLSTTWTTDLVTALQAEGEHYGAEMAIINDLLYILFPRN